MELFIGITNYLVFFAITAGTYAILTLGLNIQWGYTGLFNIGVAAFFAIGAYTSALLVGPPPGPLDWRTFGGFELPFIAGIISAMLVAGLLALVVGIPTLRLKEDYLAIATIGIAEAVRLVLKNEGWLTNTTFGLRNLPSPLRDPIQNAINNFLANRPDLPSWLQDLVFKGYNWFYLLLTLLILVILYFTIERLIRSPWGRALRAVREDEDAAAMSGKAVFRFKMRSLILGAMIMGLAGSVYAHYVRYVDADTFKPFFGTFLIWVMLIAGGSGNNKGAILGAFTIWGIWAGTGFLTDYLPFSSTQTAALRIVAIGVLLETVLILRPQGILEEEKKVSKMLIPKLRPTVNDKETHRS